MVAEARNQVRACSPSYKSLNVVSSLSAQRAPLSTQVTTQGDCKQHLPRLTEGACPLTPTLSVARASPVDVGDARRRCVSRSRCGERPQRRTHAVGTGDTCQLTRRMEPQACQQRRMEPLGAKHASTDICQRRCVSPSFGTDGDESCAPPRPVETISGSDFPGTKNMAQIPAHFVGRSPSRSQSVTAPAGSCGARPLPRASSVTAPAGRRGVHAGPAGNRTPPHRQPSGSLSHRPASAVSSTKFSKSVPQLPEAATGAMIRSPSVQSDASQVATSPPSGSTPRSRSTLGRALSINRRQESCGSITCRRRPGFQGSVPSQSNLRQVPSARVSPQSQSRATLAQGTKEHRGVQPLYPCTQRRHEIPRRGVGTLPLRTDDRRTATEYSGSDVFSRCQGSTLEVDKDPHEVAAPSPESIVQPLYAAQRAELDALLARVHVLIQNAQDSSHASPAEHPQVRVHQAPSAVQPQPETAQTQERQQAPQVSARSQRKSPVVDACGPLTAKERHLMETEGVNPSNVFRLTNRPAPHLQPLMASSLWARRVNRPPHVRELLSSGVDGAVSGDECGGTGGSVSTTASAGNFCGRAIASADSDTPVSSITTCHTDRAASVGGVLDNSNLQKSRVRQTQRPQSPSPMQTFRGESSPGTGLRSPLSGTRGQSCTRKRVQPQQLSARQSRVQPKQRPLQEPHRTAKPQKPTEQTEPTQDDLPEPDRQSSQQALPQTQSAQVHSPQVQTPQTQSPQTQSPQSPHRHPSVKRGPLQQVPTFSQRQFTAANNRWRQRQAT